MASKASAAGITARFIQRMIATRVMDLRCLFLCSRGRFNGRRKYVNQGRSGPTTANDPYGACVFSIFDRIHTNFPPHRRRNPPVGQQRHSDAFRYEDDDGLGCVEFEKFSNCNPLIIEELVHKLTGPGIAIHPDKGVCSQK